jgi:spore photoproduct lyase
MPRRVLFTRDALAEPFGREILDRVEALGLPVERLGGNRVTGLRGETERDTYRRAKQTLIVANAPAGQFKLTPIPPSADWQFHLAQGCPAHCQYCYLAGSLSGPPATRVYANLPQILANTVGYEKPGEPTTFEASCYTDPLALEHLTGSLARAIAHFGTRPPDVRLRWVTKFASVDGLIGLDHGGRTRPRFSVNAREVERFFEGGTDSVDARLGAARRLALPPDEGGGGYPVGLVVAPIVPIGGWRDAYADLLDRAHDAVGFAPDLTFELITHRFTAGSKNVLQEWYPKSKLDLDESTRSEKRGKFGGVKYVYTAPQMSELRTWFAAQIGERFPHARILYWT